jgi:hypothetical protein
MQILEVAMILFQIPMIKNTALPSIFIFINDEEYIKEKIKRPG